MEFFFIIPKGYYTSQLNLFSFFFNFLSSLKKKNKVFLLGVYMVKGLTDGKARSGVSC